MRKDANERHALPTPQGERFEAMLRGTTRAVAKKRRAGDATGADTLQRVADEMADRLGELRTARAAEKAAVKTPQADAVEAAAKELRKALPGCFPSIDDARAFAKTLPLIEARAAQVREGDARALRVQDAARKASAFWKVAEKAAKLVYADRGGNLALQALESAGEL